MDTAELMRQAIDVVIDTRSTAPDPTDADDAAAVAEVSTGLLEEDNDISDSQIDAVRPFVRAVADLAIRLEPRSR